MYVDLGTSTVYVRHRNKLICVELYQHKGERFIGKAIKGSMVLDDLFIYFEITGAKRVRQDKVQDNKIERTTGRPTNEDEITSARKILFCNMGSEITKSKGEFITKPD